MIKITYDKKGITIYAESQKLYNYFLQKSINSTMPFYSREKAHNYDLVCAYYENSTECFKCKCPIISKFGDNLFQCNDCKYQWINKLRFFRESSSDTFAYMTKRALSLGNVDSSNFIIYDIPNLAFLRCEEIKEGFTVTFDSQLATKSELKKYFENVKLIIEDINKKMEIVAQ